MHNRMPASGNTILEYAAIGALVGMASIYSLGALGSSIDRNLEKPTGTGGTLSILQAQPGTAASASAGATQIQTLGNSSSSSSYQACFSNGQCLDVTPIIPSPTVATAGSLGNELTYAMANILDQIKKQLESSNADPQTLDLVSKLALEGHAIGDFEKQLAGTVQSCTKGTQVCKSNQANYATTYNGENHLLVMKDDLLSMQNQLSTYLKKNPQALSNFPEAAAIISKETQQIATLAANISPGIAGDPNWSYHISATQLVAGLETQNGTSLTHLASNSICSQGGKQCTRP